MDLISAVMITGKQNNEARRLLARQAIKSFAEQTYGNKELVIVTDGMLVTDEPPVWMRQILAPQGLTLGELRNVGLAHAKGRWVCQWDDDDYSHPDRMAYQMQLAAPGTAVLLRAQVRYSFVHDTAYVHVWPRHGTSPGVPGTVLHDNLPGLRYPSLRRGEDDEILKQFTRVAVCENHSAPEMYLRFYHGQNTFSAQHIMGDYATDRRRGRWDLPGLAADFLRKTLASYGEAD